MKRGFNFIKSTSLPLPSSKNKNPLGKEIDNKICKVARSRGKNGRGEQKLEEGEVVAAVVKIRKHGARTFTLARLNAKIRDRHELGREGFFLNCKLTPVFHGVVASGGRGNNERGRHE